MKFDPEKLSVEYRDGVTTNQPLISRCHTLTHFDSTGELFLTIGKQFAWDKVNPDMRDEVLGVWSVEDGKYLNYYVFVYAEKEDQDFLTALNRVEVFKREMPLALTAIRYGDRFLFQKYPILDNALIIVHFISRYPQLFLQEPWGNFIDFTEQ